MSSLLEAPWIGKISLNFEKQTKTATNRCYQVAEPRIIFTTRKILPAIHKNVLPSVQQSMVVQYIHTCAAVTVVVVVVVVVLGCFRGMTASYVQRGHKRITLSTEVLLT